MTITSFSLIELTMSSLGETKKSVAAYLHGTGLQTLSQARKAYLSRIPSRNVAARAAVRNEQRQMVATPYQTNTPQR